MHVTLFQPCVPLGQSDTELRKPGLWAGISWPIRRPGLPSGLTATPTHMPTHPQEPGGRVDGGLWGAPAGLAAPAWQDV